ncbi:hypothetical protein [Burkholderia oklahomensis]|uniref:hypothetical protein n=1 Tax=Burkholderia oklahomensis TaxID=342113 RepID=UPI0002F125AF|nr:hypothetical protein [Burkholderia oklahomensis]AOI40244.1 hypothetical protein WG70_11865 [Burkholderia oklahomensis EO147]KUY48806.1 hypothetical protein WG70_21805 [Burkholderia oklahomensis EO147]QPS39387.1 hypothetical protein I6G57_26425 [Burkholderia oklahomensis]
METGKSRDGDGDMRAPPSRSLGGTSRGTSRSAGASRAAARCGASRANDTMRASHERRRIARHDIAMANDMHADSSPRRVNDITPLRETDPDAHYPPDDARHEESKGDTAERSKRMENRRVPFRRRGFQPGAHTRSPSVRVKRRRPRAAP